MEGYTMQWSKKSGWLFLCIVLLTVLMASSLHQAVSAGPGEPGTQVQTKADKPETATPDTQKDTKKDSKKDDAKAPDTIFIYGLILVSFIMLPTIIDIFLAYHSRNKNWQLLIEKASKDNLTKEELEVLIKATSGGPPGIAGMSRSLMAFAVLIILGIALFHLMAYCRNPLNDKITTIISNVLSMLGATLASITGFYFGGRSAEAKETAKGAPEAGGASGAGGAGAGAAGGAGGGAAEEAVG
jgi:hypothetical protein